MEEDRRLDQANVEDEDLLPFARYADTQNGNYHGNQPRERLPQRHPETDGPAARPYPPGSEHGEGEHRSATTHLTYCLNIHAGEHWPDVFDAIRTYPCAVRRRVAPGQPFGLGLRLGRTALDELTASGETSALRDFLDNAGLYVFTINGFPYGVFHATPVKDAVYRPDWGTPERRDYTLALARLLADLLPAATDGSISTVPLTYRPWHQPDSILQTMAVNLAEVTLAMAALFDETGCEIHLGLEPEPDCRLETTADVIDVFQHHLLPHAIPYIRKQRSCSPDDAEALFRRHIGVCVDTCHLSLQFERPADSLRRLHQAGIRISKIQLSAALKTSPTPAALKRLEQFVDPVYLHQVKSRDNGHQIESRGDLQAALTGNAGQPPSVKTTDEWRIHFHVPLHYGGDTDLRTTRDDLDSDFFTTVRELGIRHLEIETYTYSVLPDDLQSRDVVDNIAGEYEWVLAQWNANSG